MNGTRAHWAVTVMAAILGALAALLAVECLHGNGSPVVYGQTGEAVGPANNVLALMGATTQDATPIIVIDTHQQVIMVYEFMVSVHKMVLRSVRSFAADRELLDTNFYNVSDPYTGPSVDDIKRRLRR